MFSLNEFSNRNLRQNQKHVKKSRSECGTASITLEKIIEEYEVNYRFGYKTYFLIQFPCMPVH
jgi:hypothetical protein